VGRARGHEDALAKGNTSSHAVNEIDGVLHALHKSWQKGSALLVLLLAGDQEKVVRQCARNDTRRSARKDPRPEEEGRDHHVKRATLGNGAALLVGLARSLREHVDSPDSPHHISEWPEDLPWASRQGEGNLDQQGDNLVKTLVDVQGSCDDVTLVMECVLSQQTGMPPGHLGASPRDASVHLWELLLPDPRLKIA